MLSRAARILLSASFIVCCFAQALRAQDWHELRGDHFLIYHKGNEKFAKEVLRQSEAYYNEISDALGYVRYSNFWSWENRVKIFIYPTRNEFLEASGRQNWSHGYANYRTKEIISYEWKSSFLESLLPHEIAHLVFRDYVGFKGEVPLWLDEGVAQWQEPEKRAIVQQVMETYLISGKWFSFKDLTEIDIRRVPIEAAVQLYYVQAVSLVDFLVSKYGIDNFILLCRQLRDGKNLEDGLKFVYPTKMRNLTELEEEWKHHIVGDRKLKREEMVPALRSSN